MTDEMIAAGRATGPDFDDRVFATIYEAMKQQDPEVKRLREALELLAHNFETGWAGPCPSRASVIARAEQIARVALKG